ncbi:MAG TPA: sigma-70 family RNA polymerase sigma factor [Acidobacteriota bacterium]|nr:sigma-70 family RNA polymerase sigma factor [Acidobacteriota bacterium]
MAEMTRSISSGIELTRVESMVDRLKAGDEAAFEEVFSIYKDMVYGLAYRLLADKAEAMDVTQEVFLTLHRKIARFRGECTLKTWLYRVAFNQAANRNRWWKRRRKDRTRSLSISYGNDDQSHIDPDDGRPKPDHQLYSREVQQALQRCLRRLPFDQRAALVLRDVQGLTYEEIAELTGAQLGTVKSRIARGRSRMRDMLKPYREGKSL